MGYRQDWFYRGYDAFKRSAPHVAERVPVPFYVCPLCLDGFTELCLTDEVPVNERLTDEHVPPESAGGKRMLLTCGPCNWRAGTDLDSHMRREADTHDFMEGNLREVKAHMDTGSARIPIRFSISENQIKSYGVPKATNPQALQQVMRDFEGAAADGVWEELKFRINFEPYSWPRASASWLRSAYLAFFSALGYRFICRPEMRVVREWIKAPHAATLGTFRVIRPEESEPLLLLIEEPDVFRSYAMCYGHNVIFLPRYNDPNLFNRLAHHPETQVDLRVRQYPWPTSGPLFLHDQVNA
jgi:hypothetical protein